MRISDWSSDVCSSDLAHAFGLARQLRAHLVAQARGQFGRDRQLAGAAGHAHRLAQLVLELRVDQQHVQGAVGVGVAVRSEEHTSELQSLMRISYAVFCLKKKIKQKNTSRNTRI